MGRGIDPFTDFIRTHKYEKRGHYDGGVHKRRGVRIEPRGSGGHSFYGARHDDMVESISAVLQTVLANLYPESVLIR